MTRYSLIGDLREGRTTTRPRHIHFPRLNGYLADMESDYREYRIIYRHAEQIIPTRYRLLLAPNDSQLSRYRDLLGSPLGLFDE